MSLILHCVADERVKERGRVSFDDVTQLLEVRDSGRLKSIMSSISCLVTIAVTGSSEDVSHLIDFVHGLRLDGYRVAKTELFVLIPLLNHDLIQNKTINFNVVIKEHGVVAGIVDKLYLLIQIFFVNQIQTAPEKPYHSAPPWGSNMPSFMMANVLGICNIQAGKVCLYLLLAPTPLSLIAQLVAET